MDFKLRPATQADKPGLEALIQASAQALSRGYYTEAQVQAAIAHVFGVDSELIEDGTYYLADRDGTIVGCGGWSQRKTLFGGDRAGPRAAGKLEPGVDAAKIRAFFVHPDWARHGVGRAILQHCEERARAAGFHEAELMATLPGVPFYRKLGYSGDGPITYDAKGTLLEFLPMRKRLSGREATGGGLG